MNVEAFAKDIIEVFVKHGIKNPESFLRNVKIKSDYKQLQREGKKSHESFEILGNRYFVDSKTIECIIYAGNKKDDQQQRDSTQQTG